MSGHAIHTKGKKLKIPFFLLPTFIFSAASLILQYPYIFLILIGTSFKTCNLSVDLEKSFEEMIVCSVCHMTSESL